MLKIRPNLGFFALQIQVFSANCSTKRAILARWEPSIVVQIYSFVLHLGYFTYEIEVILC